MSQALWCDKGQHAFSSKDNDKQHFTQTRTVQVPTMDSYGRPVNVQRQEETEELDICGPCWADQNPFLPPEPDSDDTANLEYKALEAERDMYKSQAEANRVRPRRTTNGVVRGEVA